MNLDANKVVNVKVWPVMVAIIIPQVLLILLNIQGWTLVRGEASEAEHSVALGIFLAELAIIGLATTYLLFRNSRFVPVSIILSLTSLVIHIGFMFGVLSYLNEAIPNSVQAWILNQENVARWNITLFMPGAFLSLYALTQQFFKRFGRLQSSLIIALTTFGIPIIWYSLISVMQPIWFGQLSVVVGIICSVSVVVIFLAGIIKLFDGLVTDIFSGRYDLKYTITVALLAIAAPLCGLWLNHHLPFPADFQSFGVYLFALINGLVLLIKPVGARLSLLRLFLRCLTLPFIAYFFLVFLPYLPLSLIAIIAMGAGVLMLTPLALGLFQTRITLIDFGLAKRSAGSAKAVTVVIIGLAILPSYFTVQALLDKRALDTSLSYFYSHNDNTPSLSKAKVKRTAATLIQLRDRKLGTQLPFISGAYNSLVFGNLVLSDRKIERMFTLLTGTPMPSAKNSLFGRQGRPNRTFRGGRVIAAKRDIGIKEVAINEVSEHQATVRITLENYSSDTHSLYVEQLAVPEGAFITGLRLKIGDKWEVGRVFDRKTAIWVFEKITEVRRDPALLYFTSAREAQLRVYPFPAKGVREVEIDFQFHPKLDATVILGQRAIDLNPSVNLPALVSPTGELISNTLADSAFVRENYLHFILDYSATATATSQDYAEKIVNVIKQLGVNEYRISAANISSAKSSEAGLLTESKVDEISNIIDSIALDRVGGLWLTQAMATEARARVATRSIDNFKQRPLFVVLSENSDIEKPDSSTWNSLLPDVHQWYAFTNNALSVRSFLHSSDLNSDLNSEHLNTNPDKVVALLSTSEINSTSGISSDSAISIISASQSSLYGSQAKQAISLYQPTQDAFVAVISKPSDCAAGASWIRNAALWALWQEINSDPVRIENQRSELLKKSRELSLLLPTTSLIVVESASQWEILKRKEKQSLNNHSALDFEEEQETPEPVWWLLLAALLGFLYYRDSRTRLSSKKS